jgi:mono/diheme cytochrome c family protein
MKKGYQLLVLLALFFLLAGSLGACSKSTTTATTSAPLDGQALMQQRCSVCHTLDRIQTAHKTADEWQTTVGRMIGKGAQLTAVEKTTLVDYLAQTYP